MAYITFYSLTDYNRGDLIAKSFDLDELNTYELLNDARAEWLDDLTLIKNDGCIREEWIVADADDVPDSLVGEWDIDRNFGDWIEACAEHGEDMVAAAMALDIPLDKIDDAYYGQADSHREFAEEFAENSGLFEGASDELTRYFDVEAYARDLMINSFIEHDGYYFHAAY